MSSKNYEGVKRWRAKYPDKWREQMRRYREKCKDKISASRKRYRENNKDKIRVQHNVYYKKRDAFYRALKQGIVDKVGGCQICGEKDVRCLDFHHRGGSKKGHTVSSLYHTSYKKLEEEIKLCDIVCANCHRKLHNGGGGFMG